MASAAVSAASYAAAGDKKNACLMAAGIAAAAVGAGGVVVAFKAAKIANAARAGEGAYGLGRAGGLTSNLASRMFVGMGSKVEYDGGRKVITSADGLRRYGTPISKDRSGMHTSNFYTRASSSVNWKHFNRAVKSGKGANGHLNVKGWY